MKKLLLGLAAAFAFAAVAPAYAEEAPPAGDKPAEAKKEKKGKKGAKKEEAKPAEGGAAPAGGEKK
jgi:hypothetical protein